MSSKFISIILSLSLLFQQAGYAQIAAELNIANYLSRISSGLAVDKFRPPHLRYFSYDPANDNFKLLVDKGDQFSNSRGHFPSSLSGNTSKESVPWNEAKFQSETQTLLKYFLIGVTLPDSMFWVNLRPDSEGQILDPSLEKTDVGKIMLESDLQLKKDTAAMTSPATSEGREYWDKLYKKAEELYGTQEVTIPTLTRPWIVPAEVIIRESADDRGLSPQGTVPDSPSAYIYKATLKVMLEQDYLKSAGCRVHGASDYTFKDERAKALNEYSTQLIRELIIPKLTKEVNSSKRYAPLRQVYYSLILSRWFKQKFRGQQSQTEGETFHQGYNETTERKVSPGYVALIDTQDLTNLTSKDSWSKTECFEQYKKSFADGEYNIKEPAFTPTGQVIRSYFSGGIALGSSAIQPDSFTSSAISPALLDAGILMGGNSVEGIKSVSSPARTRAESDMRSGIRKFAMSLETITKAEGVEKVTIDLSRGHLSEIIVDNVKGGLRSLSYSWRLYISHALQPVFERQAKIIFDEILKIDNNGKEPIILSKGATWQEIESVLLEKVSLPKSSSALSSPLPSTMHQATEVSIERKIGAQSTEISASPIDQAEFWRGQWSRVPSHFIDGRGWFAYGEYPSVVLSFILNRTKSEAKRQGKRVRIIDLGSGANLYLARKIHAEFESQGISAEIHALDVASEEDVQRLSTSRDIIYHNARIEDPSAVETDSMDIVVSTYTIDYTDMAASLRQINRILTKDGRAFLVVHHPESDSIERLRDYTRKIIRAKNALEKLLIYLHGGQIDSVYSLLSEVSRVSNDTYRYQAHISQIERKISEFTKSAWNKEDKDKLALAVEQTIAIIEAEITSYEKLNGHLFPDLEYAQWFFKTLGYDAKVSFLEETKDYDGDGYYDVPEAYGIVLKKSAIDGKQSVASPAQSISEASSPLPSTVHPAQSTGTVSSSIDAVGLEHALKDEGLTYEVVKQFVEGLKPDRHNDLYVFNPGFPASITNIGQITITPEDFWRRKRDYLIITFKDGNKEYMIKVYKDNSIRRQYLDMLPDNELPPAITAPSEETHDLARDFMRVMRMEKMVNDFERIWKRKVNDNNAFAESRKIIEVLQTYLMQPIRANGLVKIEEINTVIDVFDRYIESMDKEDKFEVVYGIVQKLYAQLKHDGLRSTEDFKTLIVILRESIQAVSSQIAATPESTMHPAPSTQVSSAVGGIDFRSLPMTIKPMGSFKGLNFQLPKLSQAQLEQFNIDLEIEQIQNMASSGIIPSGQRIKELIAACVQKSEIRSRAYKLLTCLLNICKLEEENASVSDPELREALVIVDAVG